MWQGNAWDALAAPWTGAVIAEGGIPTLVTHTAELDMCKFLSQQRKRFMYTHELHSILPVLLHIIWDLCIGCLGALGRSQ
jgi:hypothetical protein